MKVFTRCLMMMALFSMTLFPMTTSSFAQDASNAVEGGGVNVEGWMGEVDAREAEKGLTIDDAIFAMTDDGIHMKTGPSSTYWSNDTMTEGSFTVMATFTEPEYMSLSDHPHPSGLIIGGKNMGTENQSFVYCMAYGNGKFLVRGFSPEPFRLNGDRQEEHEAVNTAAGEGEAVTQAIAISVTESTVSCSINGTEVWSRPKSEVVGEGLLSSTDGYVGLRVGHNAEATVSGFHVMDR